MQTLKQQIKIGHSCSGAKFDTTKQLPEFNWCYIMCLFLFWTYFHENNFYLILFPIYEWRGKHQNWHHDSKRPESSAIHQITKVGTPNGCSPGAQQKNPITHRSRSFMYNVQPWLVVGVGWHLRINTSLVPKNTSLVVGWTWTHGSFHRNLFGAFSVRLSNMGVSKSSDISKWMVKIMANPMNKWMIWRYLYHYFRKHPYRGKKTPSCFEVAGNN